MDFRLFATGFTETGDNGLALYDFNNRNGELNLVSQTNVGPNPSYTCYSDRHKLLYVINEVSKFQGQAGGGLTTLKYDRASGKFEKQNEMLVPNGGPCFISMSADSSHLFIANYPNGSVAVVKLDKSGIPERITDTLFFSKDAPGKSHAHMILHDPAGKRVYLTDLGLDRIVIYNFDQGSGKLLQLENGVITVPLRSGPRHFAFSDDGRFFYLINELGSKMMTFAVDETSGLKSLQTLPTIGKDYTARNACADIHIGKDGKYLYGSNRGENSIVVFKILDDGLLTLAGRVQCGGDWPRNFTIDPSGKWLLVGNQRSGQISIFRINGKTGIPEPAGDVKMPAVSCLKFNN